MKKKAVNGMIRAFRLTCLLVWIILFAFPLGAEALFEQWVHCVPWPDQVTLEYRKEGGISYIDTSIWFTTSGYNVSTWGVPAHAANNISVDAEIWRWTGVTNPVVTTLSHTYNIGRLGSGKYIFTFKVWLYRVMNTTFTVLVTVPDDYPTIQEAINDAEGGGAIFVRNGVYYENVVVNKTISLVGESRDSTIIDGGGSGNVIEVKANSTAIGGFKVQNGQYGIFLNFSNSNTIIGNTLSSSIIRIEGSNYNRIYHNNFYGVEVSWTGIVYHENIWDNGCEGNFWSDYNGTDLDNDGVGDTALPWQGVDYYPLMNPYWNLADINHDLKADGKDIAILSRAFASHPTDSRWNPHADINQDGKIDGKDIALVAKNFGKQLRQF